MFKKTISARLNEEAVWELEFLKSSMGDKKSTEVLTTTEVLTEAIHYLYTLQSQKQQKKTVFDLLKETGFIGAIEGEENDSVNYKRDIAERIRKKL